MAYFAIYRVLAGPWAGRRVRSQASHSIQELTSCKRVNSKIGFLRVKVEKLEVAE